VTQVMEMDNSCSQGQIHERGVDWVASLPSAPLPLLEKQNIKKFEKGCEYYGRNKGKLSGQVPHCNLYFVALLLFLVKQFSIQFQFSSYNN